MRLGAGGGERKRRGGDKFSISINKGNSDLNVGIKLLSPKHESGPQAIRNFPAVVARVWMRFRDRLTGLNPVS